MRVRQLRSTQVLNHNHHRLDPFGLEVRADKTGEDIRQLKPDRVRDLILEQRVLVFRNFAPLLGKDFPEFCSGFGEVLQFDYGVVNELRSVMEPTNYLYTNSEVPFHWDGAFIGRVPRYIFFHCDEAPPFGSGGETLFSDTTLILNSADPELITEWTKTNVRYSTEKIVHYGGTFTSPVLATHPETGQMVIRFAEPVVDLNPVDLVIDGMTTARQSAFIADMHKRLHASDVCYRHQWQAGDLVIADNNALLHGRRRFEPNAARRIRRVNVQ